MVKSGGRPSSRTPEIRPPLDEPLGTLLAVLGPGDAVLYLSPELQRVLGLIQGGRPSSPFWTPLTRPQATPSSVPGPAIHQSLVQLHRTDGQVRSAHMNTVPLPDAGIVLASFQLETGEQADAMLSGEQVRQLLYQLPVAAVGIGLAGQLLYVNAQAVSNAQMTDGVYRSFIGLNDHQYSELRGLAPDQAQRRLERLQTSIRERRMVSWIDQVNPPHQPPEYWRRSYSPVYDERGDLSLIAGTGVLVTADIHRSAELELLGQVLQSSAEAVLVIDLNEDVERRGTLESSRIIFANRVANRLLGGGDQPSLTGRLLAEVVRPLISPEQLAQLRELLLGGRNASLQIDFAPDTPAERCLEVVVAPGGPATSQLRHSHLCVTARDITESQRARRLEQGRSRVLQLVLDDAPLVNVLTELVRTLEGQLPGRIGAVMLQRGDQLYFEAAPGLPTALKQLADGRRIGPNEGVCALAAHLGEMIISPDLQDDDRFQNDRRLAREFGIHSLWSLPILGRLGQVLGTFAVYGQRPATPRPRQLAILRQLADLTALLIENRRSTDSLERVAYHDALTGLPNRSAFMQGLEEQLRPSGDWPPAPGTEPEAVRQRVAVGLIDLTDFRAVNDAYGQVAGNRLLQQLAGRLKDHLLYTGHAGLLLARMGGDEFAVMVPQPGSPDELSRLGEHLQEALAPPFQVGESEVFLRASIGWSMAPDLASDAATLLSQADTAMYTARQAGELQRLYSQHGTRWSLSPTTIRTALEHAIERQQLHVAYQPLVGRDGRVRSFEALLRWQHPEYGIIGPDQFIPVAEMSGLIRHIGSWVLEQAALAALEWPSPILISVNISGRQFEHPGFAAEVEAVLARTGLPPTRLELELTESALMMGSAQAMLTLRHLETLGVRVALDDYGVGYSNLMRLHLLPLHTIKIDRSFTRDLTGTESAESTGMSRSQSRASAAIIRSVVGLAHDLGLEVVAEGIETQAQLRAALDLGCDAIQGYLYSRPLPAPEARSWLDRRSTEH